ncbi:hypothetical protein LTR35_014764 [Friedmanniomyces endolithicus]|nr:hypothetical protein LTR35_014764 [Friedmanniomyces endolithicus]KAK0279263.1 hypothetical protein LTS00_013536 [Friedmanniomyces endolithicus]
MNVPLRPKEAEILVLPSPEAIDAARSKLLPNLPETGLGAERTKAHLQNDIVPGLNRSSQSPKYYGFVTGGVTPAAAFADNIVTETDQNVQVHLPQETISTDVEDRALRMICELLDLSPDEWSHKTFTTGATASNVLGLACGRDYVLQTAGAGPLSVAEYGLLEASRLAGILRMQVLTTVPHSSLRKAASIVGFGGASVVDVGLPDQPHRFDIPRLEAHLKEWGIGSIVDSVLCGSAWLHVDAAFGLLARAVPQTEEYATLNAGVAGLELADSIAGDAHKLLNVPYDCGIFLSKHLELGTSVFGNPNAAYLNTASSEATLSTDRTIPSPLDLGIENSRRFRALPVYATLAAYGREGYREMLERQIKLARGIAAYLLQSKEYQLLPRPSSLEVSDARRLQDIYIIVLFRAIDDQLNKTLVQRLNAKNQRA